MSNELENYQAHGCTVSISYDEGPANPWEDWDGLPPIMVFSESLTEYGEWPSLAELVNKKWHKLKNSVVVDGYTLHTAQKVYARDYQCGMNEAREQVINDDLPDEPSGWGDAERYFTLYAQALTANGIPCLHTQRNGCSQGRSVQLLLMLDDDTKPKKKADHEKALESNADLYAAWAFGDVYCYDVTDQNDDHVDGCSGFYGDGGLEQAKADAESAAQAHSESEQARRVKLPNDPVVIRAMVDAGHTVTAGPQGGDRLGKDQHGWYYIQSEVSGSCVGLTSRDGKELNSHAFYYEVKA